jgi:HEPN domain-containing protein
MNELEQWFSIAKDDLIVAKHCFADIVPKQLAIACYHSQQCAEKALKGYLLYQKIDLPKIHDLSILCKMCTEKDTSFNEIYEDSSRLSLYGVVTRYPKEIPIDETLAQMVIQRAQKIYDFCASKIPVSSTDPEGQCSPLENQKGTNNGK